MDPTAIALWCAIPFAIALTIDACELLAARAQLAAGGLYDYAVLRTGRPFMLSGPVAAPLEGLLRYPRALALPAAQLLCAAVLLVAATTRAPELHVAAGLAALTVVGVRALLHLRNQLGLDGSDQMLLVVATGLAACLLVPDRAAQSIALYYLAGQLLLAYFVAGAAKAVSPVWRSGAAVPGIMGTLGYGIPSLGAYLQRHRAAGRALCWSVIVFECSAPLLIVFGTPGALVVIAGGLAFHVGVALLMGLGGFLWSFGATYPALLYLAHAIDPLWR